MLGALTKHMHSSGLLSPEPAAPFPGLSYCQLVETVRGFRSPQWHSDKRRPVLDRRTVAWGCQAYQHPMTLISMEAVVRV
jgi:hypothetical protein